MEADKLLPQNQCDHNVTDDHLFISQKILAHLGRLHNSQPVLVLRKSHTGRCVVGLKYRPRFRADLAITDWVAVDVYDRHDFVTGTTQKNLFAEVELCAVDLTLLNLDTQL